MTYFLMTVAGLMGVILHVLIKINGINKGLKQETYSSVFKKYWATDWVSVIVSITVVLICVFISDELLNLHTLDQQTPTTASQILLANASKFIKIVFVVIGYCADSIVYASLGRIEKQFQQKAQDAGVTINQPASPANPPANPTNTQ